MLLTLLIAAVSASEGDTLPFATGEIALRGGLLVPAGSLSRLFDPAPRLGASLATSHWGSVRSRLDIDYARLDGDSPLHFVHGAAGFDWAPRPFPVELGASLSLFWVKDDPHPGQTRLSDGGETEFGIDLRAALPAWRRGPWTLRLEARLEEAFTSPTPSTLLWSGVSLARRAW